MMGNAELNRYNNIYYYLRKIYGFDGILPLDLGCFLYKGLKLLLCIIEIEDIISIVIYIQLTCYR